MDSSISSPFFRGKPQLKKSQPNRPLRWPSPGCPPCEAMNKAPTGRSGRNITSYTLW